ncbi:MAG TPA: AraC family transcriptional regulator [Polyangiales bacterium]
MVRALATGLVPYGIDRAALFQGTNVDSGMVSDSRARVPLDDWNALVNRAATLSGDRGIGLSIGGNASDHLLQIVGQLAVSCGTLREAWRMFERYRPLLGNALNFDLIEEGELAYFVLTPLVPHPELPEFDPELTLSLVYRVARRFSLVEREDAQEVWFTHRAPEYLARYAEVFRCPVRFERPRNAILLARHYLDQQQPYPDPKLADMLRETAERMLTEFGQPSLPDRVRALLRNEADLRNMDARRVAKILRIHPRTFQRQLIRANAPWSALLDETRRRIACDELGRSDVSIREIAERLGFSEPSAFTRAFKRWTGETPAKYSRARIAR